MPSPRDRYLQRTYGITESEYEEVLDAQGGGCAGCGRKPQRGKRALHLDHDHKTGVVRGIVCWRCNSTLSKAADKPSVLSRLGEYLLCPPAVEVLGKRVVPTRPRRRRRKRK